MTSIRITLYCLCFCFFPIATINAQIPLPPPPPIFFPIVPPLVPVAPGIMVVEDCNDEVFVVNGFYWAFSNGYWFKAHGPKAKWVHVDVGHVPAGIIKLPRGKYLKYKAEKVHVKHEKTHGREKHNR